MKRIFGALLGCCLAGSLQAGTISFTGAELFTNPDVSFPTTTPVVSGTSLQFGPGTADFEKLLVLPILPSGTGATTVTISMNLTRLPCVSSCSGGAADHDPLVTLGDGAILLGVQFSDNGNIFADLLTDQGTTGNRTQHTSFGPFSMPASGPFDVVVTFDLAVASTTLTVGTDSNVETGSPLNTAQAIDFVFMRDNDIGEQYQINTLTISGPQIAPPPSLQIDIKPNADEVNPITPNSRGLIPVAILTTDDFDALLVDSTTLAFGPDGAPIAHPVGHVEDVDGDGDMDLLAHFRTQETGIACGDREATLTGALFDGQPVEGSDTITTVGRRCH